MSQDDTQPTRPRPDNETTPVEVPQEPAEGTDEDPASTIGTGTSIALGCIAGTILLIVIGLIFLGLTALL